jgi:hypothetical protein
MTNRIKEIEITHPKDCQCKLHRDARWLALVPAALLASGCGAHKPIYPSEGIHQCGAEVVQADGSTWVTPCWPESKWRKPYCVKGCK